MNWDAWHAKRVKDNERAVRDAKRDHALSLSRLCNAECSLALALDARRHMGRVRRRKKARARRRTSRGQSEKPSPAHRAGAALDGSRGAPQATLLAYDVEQRQPSARTSPRASRTSAASDG